MFRTLVDAQTVFARAEERGRAAIVGAGLIGLELAAVFAQQGLDVTVLETGTRPLGRNVPQPFAERLAQRHRDNGVAIRCGVAVSACAGDGVTLSDGRRIGAGIVIAAIGVEPAADLAEAAVRMPDGAYRRFETWQNAQTQGEVAGRNLAGGNDVFTGPVSFWSDQYDLGLHSVGETSGTPAAARPLGEGAEVLYFLGTGGRLVGAAGLGTGNSAAKDIRLAHRLIEKGVRCKPAELADPSTNLKRLLKQT